MRSGGCSRQLRLLWPRTHLQPWRPPQLSLIVRLPARFRVLPPPPRQVQQLRQDRAVAGVPSTHRGSRPQSFGMRSRHCRDKSCPSRPPESTSAGLASRSHRLPFHPQVHAPRQPVTPLCGTGYCLESAATLAAPPSCWRSSENHPMPCGPSCGDSNIGSGPRRRARDRSFY
jgi:hypothetical protein